MTKRPSPAPARAALFVLFCLLASLSLTAQPVIDGAPFSADPKALLAAAEKIDAKEQSVVYLLDEGTFSFEADGRSKSVWHDIKRVVTEDGVDDSGTASAWWAPWYDDKPSIAARIIAKDGTVHMLDPKAIVEATAEQEQDIFSDERVLRAPLPGVAVGSVIEVVITLEGRSPIAGGGKYGRFQFGSGVALEHSRLTLDSAAGVTPRVVNKSGLQPRTVTENGRTRLIFDKGHTEAFEDQESYLPFDELNVPYVAFSTGTSWQEIATNYSKTVDRQIASSDGQQIASADLKDVVSAAVGNVTDGREKVDRLLDVVNKNIRYAGVEVGDGSIVPRPPKSVLQKKYGDCKDKATLLVALLRTAGITAHVALLEASIGFDTIPDLPGVSHFNHAIVVVDPLRAGEKPLWVDPTDEFALPGELPLQDQGRMALIADDATTALTRTPEAPSAGNQYIETRTFVLPEEGKAHVTEVTTGTWVEDAQLRRGAATTEKKSYRESMEKYATSYFAAPKLDHYETSDPHDFRTGFRLTVDVTSSKSGIVSNGSGDTLIPTYDIVSSLPADIRDYEEKSAEAQQAKPEKKRVHDFLFPRPASRHWVYRIVPAPGFAARTLPENETVKLGTTTLKKEFRVDPDGAVIANLTFDSGKRRLTPAEFEETRVAVSKLASQPGLHIGFDSIGQAKLNAGDVGGALTEFRKLSVQHPKEAQHHIELARALLTGGLGEAARDEAKRAVATEPKNAKAYVMLATVLENDLLGRSLRHGCDLPGAIAALKKAKELEPTDADTRAALAALYSYDDTGVKFGRKAHLSEAIDEYKSLLKDLGKEADGQRPPLMLALSHAGRWAEVKEQVKAETNTLQRDLFHLLAVTATDGSAAGLRELGAFDSDKRRSHGTAVGQTLMRLRRYNEAADFFEAAAKGSATSGQTAALVQILRKTQPYEKTIDASPRSLVMRMMETLAANDMTAFKALIVPEIADSDEQEGGFSLHSLTHDADLDPLTFLDLVGSSLEIQQDGDDANGYRLRLRAPAGAPSPYANSAFYVQLRNGKYLIGGMSNAPETVGAAVLKLADDGKLDMARLWLNWARETIAAGGGDDPLEGPTFPKLWQKEKPSATADEIRLAAAALAAGKDFSAKAAPVLVALRDSAKSDEAKRAVDVSLFKCYASKNDWARALPVAESLAKAHPDSDSAFSSWTTALAKLGKVDEGEAAVKERLTRLPKDQAAMRAMTILAAKKGDYDAAAKWSRRLVDEITPTNYDYNEAAWIALFRGTELDKAVDDARRATSAESASYATLNTLAAVYAESGKTVEARQALLKSIDKRASGEPASADWFVIGRIAETYGVRDAAIAAYKRVQKEDPDGLTTWELAQRRMTVLGIR